MRESGQTLLAQASPAPLSGTLRPPGDKSISHRALILATLAEGESRIEGLLVARDVEATADACQQLGAKISEDGDALRVFGLGGKAMTAPAEPLYMGNSGTAMRLLAGVLAAQPFDSILTGDASLNRRPMRRIAAPLSEMGASIRTRDDGSPPLHIGGGRRLRGIVYRSPVASAQVKSCVLLAGLFASGRTCVEEPAPSRDHTERMLRTFGADMPGPLCVEGGSRLTGTGIAVPADFSSAAFFLAAAVLVPDSRLLLREVGVNPTRAGLLSALEAMGCEVHARDQRDFGNEPVADIEVRFRPGIRGIELPADLVPSMIDEIPVFAVIAARAKGVTRIRGAEELRVKESDRIAVMAAGLRAMGFEVDEHADGMDITGNPEAGVRNPVEVDAAGDHRCAMSFAVLAQCLEREVRIHGAGHIDTSYPGFVADLRALGGAAGIEERAHA